MINILRAYGFVGVSVIFDMSERSIIISHRVDYDFNY